MLQYSGFLSRVHPAQLGASSDPTAAGCSWHGTLAIHRPPSPPATAKLTPGNKNINYLYVWSCARGEIAGWVRGRGMGEVWGKVGHEMSSAGMEGTARTLLRKRRSWSPPASWVQHNKRGLGSLSPSVERK